MKIAAVVIFLQVVERCVILFCSLHFFSFSKFSTANTRGKKVLFGEKKVIFRKASKYS